MQVLSAHALRRFPACRAPGGAMPKHVIPAETLGLGQLSRRGPRPVSATSPDSTPAQASVIEVGGSAPVYKAVTIACCGAFLFGYHLGVLNGPLQELAADLNFAGNVTLQGLVISISLAGAAVGSLSGSVLADKFGRCKAFFIDAIPLVAGSALCAVAASSTQVLAGRFLIGIGIGLASALVPLYISEVAPAKIRGTLGSINQLMICLGILAALVVNVLLPPTQWRTMFWISVIPAAIMGLGMLTGSESPSYLLLRGEKGKAEASAKALWGEHYSQELYGTGSTPTDLESGSSKSDDVSWGQMFTGTNGRLVAIAASLFAVQQFSGINAIVYFSSNVFRDAGVPSEAVASAAVGLINVIGTLVAASLMDRSGRKQLLTVSLVGQGLSMLVMAAAFGLPALSGVVGPVALIFTLLYVFAFALGTGPVPGLLSAELLPVSIRGRGVSLAMVVHWVFNFMVGQLFLQAVAAYGTSAVYCFFATVSLCGALYISLVLVETKGRTPKEIAKLME